MRLWFLLFTLIPVIGMVYAGMRIWQLVPPSAMALKVVLEVLLCGGFISLMTMFLGARFANGTSLLDKLPLSLSSAIYSYGASWLFVLLYVVMFFVVADVARFCFRTSFFTASWGGLLVFSAFMIAVFVYGYFHYHEKRRVELNLTTEKPLGKERLKVVLVSDLHLGYINRVNEAKRWVELINQENADLILMGGDLIDMSLRPLYEEQAAQVLRQLNAPVYACLGNHEYISGQNGSASFYEQAGIHLLIDSVVSLGEVNIVGRDDSSNANRHPLGVLMHDIDTSRYTFLLDHQPFHLEQAMQNGVDFQFSGHTHEGQMFPINLIIKAIYECGYGNYKKGNTLYYISSGIGIWGAKFRVGTCSEYVVLNLSN